MRSSLPAEQRNSKVKQSPNWTISCQKPRCRRSKRTLLKRKGCIWNTDPGSFWKDCSFELTERKKQKAVFFTGSEEYHIHPSNPTQHPAKLTNAKHFFVESGASRRRSLQDHFLGRAFEEEEHRGRKHKSIISNIANILYILEFQTPHSILTGFNTL